MMLRAALCMLVLVACVSAQTLPWSNAAFGWTSPQNMDQMYGDGQEFFLRDTFVLGKVWFLWNQSANYVDLHVNAYIKNSHAHVIYPHDPSTKFNQYPVEVHGGRYRLCIVHHLGELPIELYYDVNGNLLGSEYDYYGNGDLPSMNLTTAQAVNGMVMIMTDWLNVNNGIVDQIIRFRYDQFLNFQGTTGIALGKANFTFGDITTKRNLYSRTKYMTKPLPSFSWADILTDWNNGGSMAVLPTYQPFPEPDDLAGADNLMRGAIALFGSGLAGQFGPRLYDTPTCWASNWGTPSQKAAPWDGDVQLGTGLDGGWWGEACIAPGQGY